MTIRRAPRTATKRPAAMTAAALCLLLLAPAAPSSSQTEPGGGPSEEVTAATGPSRLTSLGLPFDRTSLGRIGVGGGGAAGGGAAGGAAGWWLRQGFEASGADLYRLNCRSCHGARGGGLPPEILPIVPLVRETSSELIKEQMAANERPVDSALAEQMAANARRNLRARLLHGGAKMIPFDHLAGAEFNALSAHLQVLAEVPGAEETKRVPQSVDRLGEHLVKGTCQICHDATPSSATPAGRTYDPDIPALARMTEDYSLAGFLRGAHHVGSGDGARRGRGPKLSYLRDEELMAAYVYLVAYPPE